MTSTPPALSGSDELQETLELLSHAVVSISDRLDDQNKKIDSLTALLEASPKPAQAPTADAMNDSLIGKTIVYSLGPIVEKLEDLGASLRNDLFETGQRFNTLLSLEKGVLEQLRKERDAAEIVRLKRKGMLAIIAIGGVVLGIGIGVWV